MSILKNCLKAFSFVGALSVLNIATPVLAANSILIPLDFLTMPDREISVSIAELERFAQTGDRNDLSYSSDILLQGFYNHYSDIQEYYYNQGLNFDDFLKDTQQQLNRQIPNDPSSPLDSVEEKLLQLLLGNIDEEDWNVASKLIAKRAGNKNLITVLKTLPVDIITEDNVLEGLRAYRPIKPATLLERPLIPLGVGTPLYSSGQELTINVLGSGAAFTSSLYLIRSPQHYEYIASNKSAGAVINLTPIPAAQELLFGLSVHNTGYWYYTGDPRRNPDGISHARVNHRSPGVVQVGFEDQFGGGDFNFADHNFLFSGINTLPQLLNIQSATTVRRGDFFDFYASAHDWETPDGLNFAWDFNGDGQIDYEGAEGPVHWNYGKKGIYNSKLTVTDGNGLSSQHTFQTEVVPEPSAVGSFAFLGLFGLGKIASRKRKGA